jgi:hypothetical protein
LSEAVAELFCAFVSVLVAETCAVLSMTVWSATPLFTRATSVTVAVASTASEGKVIVRLLPEALPPTHVPPCEAAQETNVKFAGRLSVNWMFAALFAPLLRMMKV